MSDADSKNRELARLVANSGKPSRTMAVARILVGIMFLFFAQYKLMQPEFAHGGYEKYVTGYINQTSVNFYKPVLRLTLTHPIFSGYAVGIAELLIGISMLLGIWVRPFSIVGALFMLNLTLATWCLPPGSAPWKYLGNQVGNIPLLLLFLVFFAHNAGATLGLGKARNA
jgi:uncharacterized membrane protein YphA (DoxX/SURF4 family)